MPVAGLAFRTCNGRQVIGCHGPLTLHSGEDIAQVAVTLRDIVDRTVLPRLEGPPAVAQQRPITDSDDRGFVSPLLGKFTRAVQEILESGAVIGTKPGPDHEEVRRQQNVDEVELQDSDRTHRPPKVPRIVR